MTREALNEINVGIIGFGLAGRVFHGPIIKSVEGIKVKAICTANKENTRMAKELHPDAKIVTDAKKIFADKSIDLVVIVTPNTSHYDMALAAIESGKHVIVDKPFMITSQDADRIIEKAREKGVMLSVYQNRRWDGDYMTLKKVARQGLIGDIVEMESHFDRYAPEIKQAWRTEDIPGSGMLYDLGSHLIDQAMDLFGKPQAVTADVRTQRRNAKVDDNFEVTLHFDEGVKAVLKSSMLVRGELPRFVLFGQDGTYIKYGMDVQEDDLKAGMIPAESANWGKEPEEYYGLVKTTINSLDFDGQIETEAGDYRKYYENIVSFLQGKEDLIVRAEQSRNVIRVIEYAIESNRKGMTVACSELL